MKWAGLGCTLTRPGLLCILAQSTRLRKNGTNQSHLDRLANATRGLSDSVLLRKESRDE